MCTAGVVGHAGWLPSVSCCSRRYSISTDVIHLFLILTGDGDQRAAPCSKPGSAGWDLQSDTNPSQQGRNGVAWKDFGCPHFSQVTLCVAKIVIYSPTTFLIICMNSRISVSLHAYCPKNLSPSFWQCLAYLVANTPYHRLRPGLLSPLWKQMRPYVRHRGLQIYNLDHNSLLGK